jgi:hypothetical protein
LPGQSAIASRSPLLALRRLRLGAEGCPHLRC